MQEKIATFEMNEKGEVTKAQVMNLGEVPSRDPLAFVHGKAKGVRYKEKGNAEKYDPKAIHGSPIKELAQEYLRGFLYGCRGILVREGTVIKRGQECNNHFEKQNIAHTLKQNKK